MNNTTMTERMDSIRLDKSKNPTNYDMDCYSNGFESMIRFFYKVPGPYYHRYAASISEQDNGLYYVSTKYPLEDTTGSYRDFDSAFAFLMHVIDESDQNTKNKKNNNNSLDVMSADVNRQSDEDDARNNNP